MNAAQWLLDRLRKYFVDPRTSRVRKRRVAASVLTLLMVLSSAVLLLRGQTPAGAKEGDGDCGRIGSLLADVMPAPDPAKFEQMSNPCIEIGAVVDWVFKFVPDTDESDAMIFLRRVAGVITRLQALGDMTRCGYQTDHLAIMAFRDRTTWWSAGVAVAVRGSNLEALIDTSECFWTHQIVPFLSSPAEPTAGPGSTPAQPSASPSGTASMPRGTLCVDARQWQQDGQNYTLLWLGSSDGACLQLGTVRRPQESASTTPSPSEASSPAVPGDRPITHPRGIVLIDGLAMRTGPATWYSKVSTGELPKGWASRAYCYTEGQTISDARFGSSSYWILTEHIFYGFVAHTYFDTGGDIRRQIRHCTDREIADPEPEVVTGTVTVDQARLRVDPSRSSAPVAFLPSDTKVDVICYARGESVSDSITSDLWVMVFLDKGSPGFVWGPYLDTEGDVTSQVFTCP